MEELVFCFFIVAAGITIWRQKSGLFRQIPHELPYVSSFTLYYALILLFLALIGNYKVVSSVGYFFQLGTVFVSLYFTFESFHLERENPFLKITSIAIVFISFIFITTLAINLFQAKNKNIYGLFSIVVYQIIISSLSFLFIGFMIFIRGKNGNWDILDFFKNYSKHPFKLDLGLLILMQVYFSLAAAFLCHPKLRIIITTLFFCMFIILVFLGVILAIINVFQAIFPIEYFLIPSLGILFLAIFVKAKHFPWIYIAINGIFFLWVCFVSSILEYKEKKHIIMNMNIIKRSIYSEISGG